MVVALRLVQVGGEHLKLDSSVDIFRMSLQPSGLGGESGVGLDHAFLEAERLHMEAGMEEFSRLQNELGLLE